MKNRESFLFSVLLLLINTAGVAGAALSCLGIGFVTVLRPTLFLCGMLYLCLLSAVLWSTRSRRRMALQWILLAVVSLGCVLLFRRSLADGLCWSLQEVLGRINERYGVHLVWSLPRQADMTAREMGNLVTQATWSILAVMSPLILLLGYAVVRKRALALLAADAIWFTAACAMDHFPDYVWLVLCILGLAAVVVRGAFRDDERAGMQAALLSAAALGVVMALVYRFAVPFLDSRYEAAQQARDAFYRKINGEWIPGIERALARFGSGSGTDVTGELARGFWTAYTSEEIYRVTLSSAPEFTVYLRGFVGRDYEGDRWTAAGDADMEEYYRRAGWELPESGRELVNLTYGAFSGGASGKVWVEELGAPGSYTAYPYGAQLTEDYRVHWDGTAEWNGESSEFPYSPPEDYSPERKPAGTAAEMEARYRRYVYDTFCEYSAERFPALTYFLENAEFRTDSVYHSLEDVLAYLTENAVYNLDAPNTPKKKDFVQYFLFESKEGYCAHFASAAVLILRYLGIPARYATGYAASPGEFTPNADGTCSAVVLDRQAHAWAEIYLDGIGWIPVEMTPGAAAFPRDNAAQQLALAGQLAEEAQKGENAWEVWNVSSGKETENGRQESSGKDDPADSQASGASGEQEDTEGQEDFQGQYEPGEQEGSRGEGESGEGESEQGGSGGGKNPGSRDPNQEDSSQKAPEQENSGGGEDSRKSHIRVNLEDTRGSGEALLIMLPLVLWTLGFALLRQIDCGRLRRAEGKEKIFLLYRSMRRLFAVSGCSEKLNGSEESAMEFIRFVEKYGFGRDEPGSEELEAARRICERLAREAYGGLPLYKKALFSGFDVYDFIR